MIPISLLKTQTTMRNPIIHNKRRKRFYRFLKYYFYSFLFILALTLADYKTGSAGKGRNPTYYKPKPNTWQYVFEHLPEILVFSLGGGLLLTLPLPPSKDE